MCPLCWRRTHYPHIPHGTASPADFISTPDNDDTDTQGNSTISGQSTIEGESYDTIPRHTLDTPDAADLSDDPGEDASPGPVALWDTSHATPAPDAEAPDAGGMLVDLNRMEWNSQSIGAQENEHHQVATEHANEPWDNFYGEAYPVVPEPHVKEEEQAKEVKATQENEGDHALPLVDLHTQVASTPSVVVRASASRPACPLTPLSPLMRGRRTVAEGPSFGDRAGALMAVVSAIDAIMPRKQRGGAPPIRRCARDWLMVSMRIVWAMYLVWCVRPRRRAALTGR